MVALTRQEILAWTLLTDNKPNEDEVDAMMTFDLALRAHIQSKQPRPQPGRRRSGAARTDEDRNHIQYSIHDTAGLRSMFARLAKHHAAKGTGKKRGQTVQ